MTTVEERLEMAAEVAEWEVRLMVAPVGATVTDESEDGFTYITEVWTKTAEGWRCGDTVMSNRALAYMLASDDVEVIAWASK